MSGHTPGPWEIDNDGASNYVRSKDGRLVMKDALSWPVPRTDAEQAANARLIAAAPELLEFSKWAMGQLCGDSGTGESYWEQFKEFRDGQSAIAKAESKQ